MPWHIIAYILISTSWVTASPFQPTPQTTPDPPSDPSDIWWTQAGRSLGNTIKECLSVTTVTPAVSRGAQIRNQMTMLSACLKHYAHVTLNTVLRDDVVPLVEGVELVKINGSQRGRASRQDSQDADGSFGGWRNMLIDTLADVFDTHAIRISMRELQVADTDTARRRRKQHMMPLMAFGMVGLGMILIPMGFQFLAVLGGKALLLAKMALILTSIQGLKKVAHSNINYGLYHSAPANPWYDRKAEDVEHPYKMDDTYYTYNPYPDQVVEYKRYPRP